MPVTKVLFGNNVYGVKAIQQAQQKPVNVQHKYVTDAVKDREFHPEARNEVLANKLDFLA